jgi:hypothetical protein
MIIYHPVIDDATTVNLSNDGATVNLSNDGATTKNEKDDDDDTTTDFSSKYPAK